MTACHRQAVTAGTQRSCPRQRAPSRTRCFAAGSEHDGSTAGKTQASQARRQMLMLSSIAWLQTLPNTARAAQVSQYSENALEKAAAVKRVVKLFLQRNFDKLETITASDAFVNVQAPASLPYAGRYTGVDCVRQFMTKFNESFLITAVPEVYFYVNESGSVFTAFDFDLQATANPDVAYTTSVTIKIKVNDDGQLVKMAVISDTLAAFEALQRTS